MFATCAKSGESWGGSSVTPFQRTKVRLAALLAVKQLTVKFWPSSTGVGSIDMEGLSATTVFKHKFSFWNLLENDLRQKCTEKERGQ